MIFVYLFTLKNSKLGCRDVISYVARLLTLVYENGHNIETLRRFGREIETELTFFHTNLQTPIYTC